MYFSVKCPTSVNKIITLKLCLLSNHLFVAELHLWNSNRKDKSRYIK